MPETRIQFPSTSYYFLAHDVRKWLYLYGYKKTFLSLNALLCWKRHWQVDRWIATQKYQPFLFLTIPYLPCVASGWPWKLVFFQPRNLLVHSHLLFLFLLPSLFLLPLCSLIFSFFIPSSFLLFFSHPSSSFSFSFSPLLSFPRPYLLYLLLLSFICVAKTFRPSSFHSSFAFF